MTLTRHPPGSFKELLSIAFPLMLSSMSVMTMLFVDRLLLANYSTEAMNAAVNAATFGWSLMATWWVLASISEVFVAQYNGAGAKEKIGEPVWQMIWVCLFSILFFVPVGLWGGEFIFGDHPKYLIAKDYFKWMMFFGPTFPFYGAVAGFFVGRGKTTLITVLAIIANLVNALLDWVLIFGLKDWIPALGPTGAAIATSGSSLFQGLILFGIFISRKNRQEYGTGQFALKISSLWQSLKIGFPGAVFVGIEVFGFAVYYWLMTMVGEVYITVAGICQSVVILLYFFAEGISKAATTVAGNLIGAKRQDLIDNVLTAGLKMHVLFFLLILIIFYCCSHHLVRLFLPDASQASLDDLHNALIMSLFCMVFYIFFEGVRLLLVGLLTSAGDTMFLSLSGIASVWLLFVLPIYLIVVVGKGPVIAAPLICIFYSMATCLIYYLRFATGKWKALNIIS